MHHARLLAGLAVGGFLVGCSPTEKAATQVQSAAQAQATPSLSTTDATFINTASQGGITEVTFGQLARQNGNRAAVRDFGAHMVEAHTTVNQRLTQLAAQKQITPINTMDTAHQAAYDQLQSLHGRAFDRAYLNAQATDHQAQLQAFQNEAANGTDPDVKAFAAEIVPQIQQHLRLAERLGGKPQPQS